MPEITKVEAVQMLTKEVEQLPADEVLEVYQSLFRGRPVSEKTAMRNPAPLVTKILRHLHSREYEEEIVGLWGVIRPKDRNVWYNEEEDRFCYNEEFGDWGA